MKKWGIKVLLPVLCTVALLTAAVGVLLTRGAESDPATPVATAENPTALSVATILERDGYLEGIWWPWFTHDDLGHGFTANETMVEYVGNNWSTVGIDRYSDKYLLEQQNVPVSDGETYTLSLWYKANAVGANVSMIGNTTGTQYTYLWAANGQWTHFSATFTVDGDTALLFNICGGGTGNAEDVYVDNIRLVPADSAAKLGVAFLMELEGYHITMDGQNRFDAPNATVIPYGDGEAYPLLRMGAVMTNDTAVGTEPETFTLSAVNGQTVTDIPAVYFWSVSDTGCEFAVRVINVPLTHSATLIYARPYYVFEKDGREVVVYGDIVSRSYDG